MFEQDVFLGKTALVVGGTRGIGEAVARHLSALGADVCVCASSAQPARKAGYDVVSADITDDASVAALIHQLPRIDMLVNCAGAISRGQEYDLDTFKRVLEVNLVGTMRVCTAARAKLAETRGVIVNMASMLTYFGGPLVPGYSASKGGVGQLTKSLAIAYATDGIRVNAVAPGWIQTGFTRKVWEDAELSDTILRRTPMNRWGTPDDIARVVVFLCSDAAAFMTGAIVPVDGGYSAV